jgi:ribosomal protein RSM22 (predicted rRNA methylase)
VLISEVRLITSECGISVCDVIVHVMMLYSQILIELGNWPGFEIIRESRELVLEVGDSL